MDFWKPFRALASAKLALLLVALLILCCLVGVTIPQEFAAADTLIEAWQSRHPILTRILTPLDGFHIFWSRTFLGLVLLLAVNTLACSLFHALKIKCTESGTAARHKLIRFLFLHLALLALMCTCLYSAASRMDGYTVLTEGATFRNTPEAYLRYRRGPLYKPGEEVIEALLTRASVEYRDGKHPVAIRGNLRFRAGQTDRHAQTVTVNRPAFYKGTRFTYGEDGYAVNLSIREKTSGRTLIADSFVSLQTFRDGRDVDYRDFLPLTIDQQRVIMRLLPSHEMTPTGPIKTAEDPRSPILLMTLEDRTGRTIDSQFPRIGQSVALGDYAVHFGGLRRWLGFNVSEDPGYILVCVSIWAVFLSLMLYYWPHMKSWTEKSRAD